MSKKYRILESTRNSGSYTGDRIMSLSAAKEYVRERQTGRLQWQSEGDDICAYVSRGDMHDEDKAVARLRPAALDDTEIENEKYWRERVEYADTHDDGSDEPWSTPY